MKAGPGGYNAYVIRTHPSCHTGVDEPVRFFQCVGVWRCGGVEVQASLGSACRLQAALQVVRNPVDLSIPIAEPLHVCVCLSFCLRTMPDLVELLEQRHEYCLG